MTSNSSRLEVRIRADKSGPQPAAGQPWPTAGVEIVGDPPTEFDFPAGWVRKEIGRGWVKLENLTVVERPSQPNPGEVKGSAAVAPEHYLAEVSPHRFLHGDYLVLTTSSHGVLRYKVLAQPDKYVDSDNPKQKVSLKHYADGNTRVDHFYRAVLEG